MPTEITIHVEVEEEVETVDGFLIEDAVQDALEKEDYEVIKVKVILRRE